MNKPVSCPICASAFGASAYYLDAGENWKVSCTNCGDYVVTHQARRDHLEQNHVWPAVKRAALSYFVRNRRNLPTHQGTGLPHVKAVVLEQLEGIGISLPLPTEQASNLIREIGNEQRKSGGAFEPGKLALYSKVGSPSPGSVTDLLYDLQKEQLVSVSPLQRRPGIDFIGEASLTLRGWREWEAMSTGRNSSRNGFIAMQFGDSRLDEFVSSQVQGVIASTLGVSINRVDSPDVKRAGIIDNIMREAIAESAFVLVELSHGNKGAYWEAGFAEGLGKPVIYLCEKAVWDDPQRRPHFDVNHCTTVMWVEDQIEAFHQQLTATIRNSVR